MNILSVEEVHERINAAEDWELVWSTLDTDGVFEALFGELPAFLYQGCVFCLTGDGWHFDTDPKEWMLRNAGEAECDHTGMLYEHAKGIEEGSDPWTLFQYITGMAVTTQGMGLNSLMPVSDRDADYLGAALREWSRNAYRVDGFAELMLIHGGEE